MSFLRRITSGAAERRAYAGAGFLPADAIPLPSQAAFLQGYGYPMSSDSAMRHSAVYACVRIIADTVASFPVDAYVGDVGMHLGEAERVTPKPSLLVRPSDYLSGVQWLHQVMMSLLLQGNAYGLISAVDRSGYPTQIDLISPEGVVVDRVAGRKVFRINGQILSTSEVWHCPGPMMPGDLAGLSPVRYASRVIGLGSEAEGFGLDFFRNGVHPTAVATTDQQVTQEQAEQIKARIKQAVASRDMPVLGAGLKVEPWQVNPKDAQLLELQQANAVQVCQVFGVPAEMISASAAGSTVTYANREQRAMDFLSNAINPWLVRLEDSFSALFPASMFVKFDTKGLLKSDLKTRYESWQIGVDGGFLTPDEVRQFEDLPGMPESADEGRAADRDVFEAVQKIYLGVVNKVITADEARTLLNRVGASLPVPGPDSLHGTDPLPDASAGTPDQGMNDDSAE